MTLDLSPDPTLVTFLLDRTGSMERIADDTIGGFNAYRDTLLPTPGIEFTLLQFDSISLDKVHVGVAVKDVPHLTHATFEPRATTPLIDAVYKTIKAVEAAVAKRTDKPKVVIAILTDGFENASTEHTWDELNALIKAKSTLGWQFNFMGASIDAYKEGHRMGLPLGATVSYDSLSRRNTRSMFVGTASNTAAFASGARGSTAYDVGQKADAGDKFDPAASAPSPSQPPPTPKAVDDFSL